MQVIDLTETTLREMNATLHAQNETTNQTAWTIENPVVRMPSRAGLMRRSP